MNKLTTRQISLLFVLLFSLGALTGFKFCKFLMTPPVRILSETEASLCADESDLHTAMMEYLSDAPPGPDTAAAAQMFREELSTFEDRCLIPTVSDQIIEQVCATRSQPNMWCGAITHKSE